MLNLQEHPLSPLECNLLLSATFDRPPQLEAPIRAQFGELPDFPLSWVPVMFRLDTLEALASQKRLVALGLVTISLCADSGYCLLPTQAGRALASWLDRRPLPTA